MGSINIPYFGQDDENSVNIPFYGDTDSSANVPMFGDQGPTPAAQPTKANDWLKRLRKMQGQQPQQQQGQGQQKPWSPVQTYQDLGSMAYNIGSLFMANGGIVPGPTPAIVGEAGPELRVGGDGSEEVIQTPQLRMLGQNGGDQIIPLTPGPHRPTRQGRELMKRLRGKHRFADGGIVDDDSDSDIAGYDADQNVPYIPFGQVGPPQFQAPPPQGMPQQQGIEAPPMLNYPQGPPLDVTGAPPAPGLAPLSIRDKIAALKTPIPEKPSILRRLAAAALGGAAGYVNASGKRMNPIDVNSATQGILYPGYADQQRQYQAQQADLQRQLAMQQGTTADQIQQAQLQHLNAQTASMPTTQLLQAAEHGLVPEANGHPMLANPEDTPETAQHAGLHVNVAGQPMYLPTKAEQAETASTTAKRNWPKVTPEMAEGLPEWGLSAGDQVDPKIYNGLSSALRQKQKLDSMGKKYKYDKVINKETGDVTYVAQDPETGQPMTDAQGKPIFSVIKGIAKEKPPSYQIGGSPAAEKQAISNATRQAYAASGGDWAKVLDNARAMKYGDYSMDIADHAQKMSALPSAQQTKVASADATVAQVQEAVSKMKEFVKNHPNLVGSGAAHPFNGLTRWAETATGTEPGDIGDVDMALSSVAALQPQQHGFRSAAAMQEFKQQLGIDLRTHKYDPNRAWLINPEKAISALEGVAKFNDTLKASILKTAGKSAPIQSGPIDLSKFEK